MRPGERGAALLTVLMLVSVMAVLSATALERLRLSTRLAANAGAIDQARAYAMAAEGIALGRITTLVEADPARTPLAGGWNGAPQTLPLPGGQAVAVVRDGGNCFNLNSVVAGQVGQPLAARQQGIDQLLTLARTLGIADGEARAVADALTDWIDSDQVPRPGGAEDARYAAEEVPYRTGGTLLADVSELRAIAGVTPELYERLRPWVCALPAADMSPTNVNTLAVGQAPLLAMLLPASVTVERARALIAARPPGGWESAYAFSQMAADQGVLVGEAGSQLGVRTRWFSLALEVRLGDSDVVETVLIDAGTPPARLVRRSWGEPL